MKIIFSKQAKKDFDFWQKTDVKKYQKIIWLLQNIAQDPFKGIGKPEPLKFELSGFWSRRIDKENRLIYRMKEGGIEVLSCRYHY